MTTPLFYGYAIHNQRYGVGGMLRVLSRAFKPYLNNPAYRQFVKDVRQDGVTPKNLDDYFGYGIYVGRKPAIETP